MTSKKNIDHIESSIKIYNTRLYNRFQILKGNRMLDERKIKRIIKDIESGTDFLHCVPIVVNEDMEILDGQHRFYVSQKLKRPVYYIIAKHIGIEKVAKVNSRSSKWKQQNFLDTWVTMGKKSYVELEKFMEKYNLSSFGVACSLLQEGMVASNVSKESFMSGNLTIGKKEEAEMIMDHVSKFDFICLKPNRNFISAIVTLLDKEFDDWDKLVSQCQKQKDLWKPGGSKKEILEQLEKFYNYRLTYRKTLY